MRWRGDRADATGCAGAAGRVLDTGGVGRSVSASAIGTRDGGSLSMVRYRIMVVMLGRMRCLHLGCMLSRHAGGTGRRHSLQGRRDCQNPEQDGLDQTGHKMALVDNVAVAQNLLPVRNAAAGESFKLMQELYTMSLGPAYAAAKRVRRLLPFR